MIGGKKEYAHGHSTVNPIDSAPTGTRPPDLCSSQHSSVTFVSVGVVLRINQSRGLVMERKRGGVGHNTTDVYTFMSGISFIRTREMSRRGRLLADP